ncbi:hypothetical protein PQX77_004298 [Marasmius sp. AFHP31]|nr:hypothetical protein PQX77_004298 [Marasmius sp. AFHP31]
MPHRTKNRPVPHFAPRLSRGLARKAALLARSIPIEEGGSRIAAKIHSAVDDFVMKHSALGAPFTKNFVHRIVRAELQRRKHRKKYLRRVRLPQPHAPRRLRTVRSPHHDEEEPQSSPSSDLESESSVSRADYELGEGHSRHVSTRDMVQEVLQSHHINSPQALTAHPFRPKDALTPKGVQTHLAPLQSDSLAVTSRSSLTPRQRAEAELRILPQERSLVLFAGHDSAQAFVNSPQILTGHSGFSVQKTKREVIEWRRAASRSRDSSIDDSDASVSNGDDKSSDSSELTQAIGLLQPITSTSDRESFACKSTAETCKGPSHVRTSAAYHRATDLGDGALYMKASGHTPADETTRDGDATIDVRCMPAHNKRDVVLLSPGEGPSRTRASGRRAETRAGRQQCLGSGSSGKGKGRAIELPDGSATNIDSMDVDDEPENDRRKQDRLGTTDDSTGELSLSSEHSEEGMEVDDEIEEVTLPLPLLLHVISKHYCRQHPEKTTLTLGVRQGVTRAPDQMQIPSLTKVEGIPSLIEREAPPAPRRLSLPSRQTGRKSSQILQRISEQLAELGKDQKKVSKAVNKLEEKVEVLEQQSVAARTSAVEQNRNRPRTRKTTTRAGQFTIPKPKTRRGDAWNEFLVANIRHHMNPMLGIKHDKDIVDLDFSKFPSPRAAQRRIEQNFFQLPIDRLPVCWEDLRCPYNERLSQCFLASFLAQYPQYDDQRQDILDHFWQRLDRLKSLRQRTSRREGETKAQCDSRRGKMFSEEQRRLRKRSRQEQLYNDRIQVASENANHHPDLRQRKHWALAMTVFESLGVQGMSSDESEDEDNNSERRYTIKARVWRSIGILNLIIRTDSAIKQTKRSLYGNAPPGNPPRARRRLKIPAHSKRTAVGRLPINFYDDDWLRKLSSVARGQLSPVGRLELPKLSVPSRRSS